jgi:NAD(P)-dependent dehydrogenase (short-subunit alcohol dehydrogenase family)
MATQSTGTSMGILKGKVAVITGGNSGIGFASAQKFIAEGATVVIVGRRQQAVDEAVAQLGASARGVVGDVTDLATHDRVAAFVRDTYGQADIYFANAGINIVKPTPEMTVEDYDQVFGINVRAVFFGVKAILPVLRDGGSIVVTTSIAANKVLPGHGVYGGSKAAAEAMVRDWAMELKDRRIRVNVLSPGPVVTAILGKLGIRDEHKEMLAKMIPLGRIGDADELAQAALFLASDQSSFVTGATLRVDGGWSLG